jgi:hypothetical protein
MVLTIFEQANSHRLCHTGTLVPWLDILEEHRRVEVSTIVQSYEDNMLKISDPKGIEKLGQAIKNFILWS